ncbi:tetratricopeptide repeat-containing sensor histidine kinase [Mucilaginibacter auburnensis]|uniref:histidine kinase n=1 Tax=Mucilaginibacter auburnensis TaxID=1457233 RepID=A0A2H9VW96_9SPHI|nr:tetratricopeptide repeat-containing sensor histidine kinase [Mucilaginibacter auburnensis]PJJ85059.1 signal transduction histidine kinase [Mucilaginibacter auburnensis]
MIARKVIIQLRICPDMYRYVLVFFMVAFRAAGWTNVYGQNLVGAAQLKAAKMHYNQGNYLKSLTMALPVYQEAVRNQQPDMAADAGNLIGLVELAQGRPQEALAYFKRAKAANEALHKEGRLAANLLNISLAKSDLHQLDSAVTFIKQSLSISKRRHLHNLTAMGNNHLADFYARQGKLAQAEQLYHTVIGNKVYQDGWENSFAYAGLAGIAFERRQYPLAAKLADRSYQLSLTIDAKWDAARALELAHRSYKAMGSIDSAYKRLLIYKDVSDSIFNATKEQQINKLKLEAQATENQNLRNAISMAEQKQKINHLYVITVTAIIIAVLLSALLIYRRISHRNQLLEREQAASKKHSRIIEEQNKKLNRLNQDKDRLLSIISHDLRSPFASLQSTLTVFRAEGLSVDELSGLLGELSTQVNAASLMLDSLLIWAANQLEGVSTRMVPIDLVAKVDKVISFMSVAARDKGIEIIHEKDTLPHVCADADQIRIIIQNLLSNALKFTPKGGYIRISYTINDDEVVLAVRDSGVGMSPSVLAGLLSGNDSYSSTYGTANEKGIGLGLQLVRDFAAKNALILSGDSVPGEGTAFFLHFRQLS